MTDHSSKFSTLVVIGIATTFLTGCQMVRDIDPNHTGALVHGASSLQSTTSTAIIGRRTLSQDIMSHVPNVSYAAVLQRKDSIYIGVILNDPKKSPPVQKIVTLVRSQNPRAQVYVSTDETLVNHFHAFLTTDVNAVPNTHDLVLSDIERLFSNPTR